MGALGQDLHYALRILVKRPGFTFIAILTLALGIGANTAIFSVVDAVVLRPLPFEDPSRIVVVHQTERGHETQPSNVPFFDFAGWTERSGTLEESGGFRAMEYTLTGVERPERIRGARVTSGFFRLLGVEAALGRTFRPEDDRAGAPDVAILGHRFWGRRFGGDPAVLGETLTLDGTVFTVVGVLPPEFSFPLGVSAADVWTPAALDASLHARRGLCLLRTVARIKTGATLEQARAEMDLVSRRLERENPARRAGSRIELVPLHESVAGNVRQGLLVLLGAVGLVLLIACANVASLLLARGTDRERELAVRAAIGAGRTRLLRQLLTENVILALAGGALGLMLAFWSTDALLGFLPREIPRRSEIGIDARVLGFTLIASLLTGVAFGLIPALRGTRVSLERSLREGGRAPEAARRHRLQNGLVVCEVALALVLLVAAGLLLRSFHRLTSVDLGFDPGSALTFRMSIPAARFSEPYRRAEMYRQILERIGTLPGVESVGATTTLPLHPAHLDIEFTIPGRPEPDESEAPPFAFFSSVSASYFRALGIRVLAGRSFTEQDSRDAPGVAIISESMARQYWPGEDPIGRAISVNPGKPPAEIVGVVADVRSMAPGIEPLPYIYFPYRQHPWPFMSFVVRAQGDPMGLAGAVRSEVAAVTREEAIYDVKTMDQRFAGSVASQRFSTLVLSLFAAASLLLTAVGIYGTLSYVAAQRTHEIGVRMALGARRGDVLRLVLGRGLGLTAIGIGIGLAASLASSRALSSQLYETGTADPLTLASVAALLACVAGLACYIPARRATRVDPIVALRQE